jgi:hypothetical protein
MKHSRRDVRCKSHGLPVLRFENQSLTSFSGLIVFQQLFTVINVAKRVGQCFRHCSTGKIFGQAKIFLQLIIHILLGYRELRDSRYYRDDPLVKRVLGLKRLPDTATISRMLREADFQSVDQLRRLLREMAVERLQRLDPRRLTLDFDGSVQSTMRFAEGTAVGFNKKKKGARSYYPLFCTVAQTGQVLDFMHRSGNVHDSNGAKAFILDCLEKVFFALGTTQVEVRIDSAFFSDEIVSLLEATDVEYSVSVPFERFVELKGMIESRQRWQRVDADTSFFECRWKPKSWDRHRRFLFVRQRTKKQRKAPIQLDLFIPHEYGYEFKVVLTNKSLSAKKLLGFHNGRGAQEGIFGELKTNCQMGYVPVRRCYGNQIYLLAALFAHNLTRELQMMLRPPARSTTEQRSALWTFEKLATLRATLLHRAGRFTRPEGKLTLTVSANCYIKEKLLNHMEKLRAVRRSAA